MARLPGKEIHRRSSGRTKAAIHSLVQQHILRFQVAVNDVPLMEVPHSIRDLVEPPGCHLRGGGGGRRGRDNPGEAFELQMCSERESSWRTWLVGRPYV